MRASISPKAFQVLTAAMGISLIAGAMCTPQVSQEVSQGDGDGTPVMVMCYYDTDGDGYGYSSNVYGLGSFYPGGTCPSGTVGNDDDCDDRDAGINPGATEVLNDGIDQNCNPADDVDPGLQIMCPALSSPTIDLRLAQRKLSGSREKAFTTVWEGIVSEVETKGAAVSVALCEAALIEQAWGDQFPGEDVDDDLRTMCPSLDDATIGQLLTDSRAGLQSGDSQANAYAIVSVGCLDATVTTADAVSCALCRGTLIERLWGQGSN